MDDADLAGPFVFCFAFAFVLLLVSPTSPTQPISHTWTPYPSIQACRYKRSQALTPISSPVNPNSHIFTVSVF